MIVDDEQPVRDLLAEILSDKYICETAASAGEALGKLSGQQFGLVISDVDMPGCSGIELVPRILETSPDTVILIISGNLAIDYAIKAIRVGAFDYIKKPFDIDFVELAVQRAIERHELLVEKRAYENDLEELLKQRTEEVNFLIYHDPLTNLPNRILFEDRLTQAIITARSRKRLALLLVSVDGFENIQKTLGYNAADNILSEIAERLRDMVDKTSTISRLQGAEFSILIPEISSTESLMDLSNRISDVVKRPVIWAGTEVFLTTSIGICIYPDDGATADELIRNAGTALAKSCDDGGDGYRFYTNGMNSGSMLRIKLETEMRHALERGEFEVYYQPKVAALSGKVVGMEALVRWNHPNRGLVPPSEFIQIAEDTGMIVQLGEFVLASACRTTAKWHAAGNKIEVAVNVSARQLKQCGMATRFSEIVAESGLDPKYLNLEVTESTVIENFDDVVARLEKLRKADIKISLDDFGTGYSSLSYLKRLPIDLLKIDRSFVQDVTRENNDKALAVLIVNLAHQFGLKVAAEGVETLEQVEFLTEIGCDELQGYYFSKPMTADEFESLLGLHSQEEAIDLTSEDSLSILPHLRPGPAAA